MPLPFILWGAAAIVGACIVGGIAYTIYDRMKAKNKAEAKSALGETIKQAKANGDVSKVSMRDLRAETKQTDTLETEVRIHDGEKGIQLTIDGCYESEVKDAIDDLKS